MAVPTHTIQERVEDVVGTDPTVGLTAGLDVFAAQEARTLLALLPPDLLSRVASRSLVEGAEGMAVAAKRILRVSRGGFPAREVDPSVAGLVGDPSSLHYASARTPVFYERVDSTMARLYVKPDPTTTQKAQVDYVAYPGDADIDASTVVTADVVPQEADEAFVLGVALRALTGALADVRAEIPDLGDPTATLPSAPLAASFPTAPDLTAALAAITTAAGALAAQDETIPTLPAALTAPTLAALTTLPTAPTALTVPAIAVNLTSALALVASAVADGVEDPELARARLDHVQATLAELTAEADAYATAERAQMDRFGRQVEAFLADVRQDIERYQAEVQAYAAQTRAGVDRYGASLSGYSAETQAEVARYSAVLEGRVADARTRIDIYARQVEAAAAQARSQTETYLVRFQAYAVESGQITARYGAAVQRVVADAEVLRRQIATVEARYARALQALGARVPQFSEAA